MSYKLQYISRGALQISDSFLLPAMSHKSFGGFMMIVCGVLMSLANVFAIDGAISAEGRTQVEKCGLDSCYKIEENLINWVLHRDEIITSVVLSCVEARSMRLLAVCMVLSE
jgi:hypothetical protein